MKFCNTIWLKFEEHEYIYIFEIKFEMLRTMAPPLMQLSVKLLSSYQQNIDFSRNCPKLPIFTEIMFFKHVFWNWYTKCFYHVAVEYQEPTVSFLPVVSR